MAPARSFVSLLTGSYSTPAGDNPTVFMGEAAYAAMGLDAGYVNCDVPASGLAAAVRGAHAMGWAWFSCSLPHKVAVESALAGAATVTVATGTRAVGRTSTRSSTSTWTA